MCNMYMLYNTVFQIATLGINGLSRRPFMSKVLLWREVFYNSIKMFAALKKTTRPFNLTKSGVQSCPLWPMHKICGERETLASVPLTLDIRQLLPFKDRKSIAITILSFSVMPVDKEMLSTRWTPLDARGAWNTPTYSDSPHYTSMANNSFLFLRWFRNNTLISCFFYYFGS